MQYADVESHETKMFELRIQRVYSNMIDPLSCKNEEAFSSEASREGCEVGMKLMADIDVNGIESCSDLLSNEMKSACQNVMKVKISLYRGTVLAPQKAKELLGSTQVYADDGSYSINRHAFKDYWVKVDLHHDLEDGHLFAWRLAHRTLAFLSSRQRTTRYPSNWSIWRRLCTISFYLY